ncbi:MAG TPA: IS66 family transposase [Polyangiales bacterium]|nr:IS66 family transposase [Polyangiales bacterium]
MSRSKSKSSKSKNTRGAHRPPAPDARAAQLATLHARARELNMSTEQSEFVASLLASFAQLGGERDILASEHDVLASEHKELVRTQAALAAELERAELRIKKLLFVRYGHKTEKLTRDELMQLMLSFGATAEEAAAEEPNIPHPPAPEEPVEPAPAEPEPAANDKPKKKRPNHPGRTALSPNLERVITLVPVPADQRRCVCCQHEMHSVKFVDHERIEYVPAKVVVHVERREVLACKQSACRGDMTTAPRTDEDGSRRRAGASLLAQLIEAKCDDGLPVERQRDQWLRLGFEVPANTLYTYWRHGTSLLVPLAKVVLATVLAEPIVGVDDTGMPVLDKSRKAGIYKGHLWCFTGKRLVAYAFTESWSADEVAPFLFAIEGFIQCDDYKGYSRELEMPDGERRVLVLPEQRLGCLMHVRRRFHEALKLGDKRAARGIELIAELYEVERAAKEQGLDADARLALRAERSLPVLDQFDAWVDALKPTCLPTSPLGKAVGYATHQRPFVRRCFTDGRFEIDNGHTERVLREPCIGRKNYLFTGSADAAERLAAAYTLVQSCRMLGFGARDYLIDVLSKLDAGWPMRRIAELVPDRWALERGLLTQREQT